MNNSINKSKHVYTTPALKYAHFSKIDIYNIFVFPELLSTHEQKYELNAGDALIIPKGWWHWIESYEDTFGVNFWLNDNKFTAPEVYKQYISNGAELLSMITDKKLCIWNDKGKNITIDTIENMRKNKPGNNYIITLNAFACGVDNNKIISNIITPHMTKPYNTALDPNFWYSFEYHDTGLHYDDMDGFLIVMSGRKKVRLFPPEDSKWLKPYPEKPEWSNYKTNVMTYPNEYYHYIQSTEHIAQSVELYYSLYNTCSIKNVYNIIDNLYNDFGKNKIVWSVKQSIDNVMRLEFYNYHFNNNKIAEPSLKSIKDFQKCYTDNYYDTFPSNDNMNIKDLIINSFNVYLNYPCVDNETHLYYKSSEIVNNAINTTCFTYSGTSHTQEGLMYGCAYNLFDLENNVEIKKIINLNEYNNIQNLCSKYKCKTVFIWNKYKYILLQFCGISTALYIDFLKQYKYPPALINWIENNSSYNDTNISHEIGFSIDAVSHNITRTAIYGIL